MRPRRSRSSSCQGSASEKPWRGEVGRERVVLVTTELEQQVSAVAQDRRRVRDDSPHHIETVVAAVERACRLVSLHVGREQTALAGRHVGRDRGDDVDGAHEVERRRKITDDHEDAIARRTARRDRIDVDAHDERARHRVLHPRGHRAAAGAEIHRGSAGRQHRRRTPRQRLALCPRYVHTRIHVQLEPTEPHPPRDPRQRLPRLASLESRFELGVVGCVVQQLTRLFVRRDAPCGGQSSSDGQAGATPGRGMS